MIGRQLENNIECVDGIRESNIETGLRRSIHIIHVKDCKGILFIVGG